MLITSCNVENNSQESEYIDTIDYENSDEYMKNWYEKIDTNSNGVPDLDE